MTLASGVLDFGLANPTARLTSVATLTAAVRQSTPMTEQGAIVGIFQYVSPEQIERKELDGRIFRLALCCTRCLQAGVRSKAKANSALPRPSWKGPHSNCARPPGDADVLGTRQAHPAPNRRLVPTSPVSVYPQLSQQKLEFTICGVKREEYEACLSPSQKSRVCRAS